MKKWLVLANRNGSKIVAEYDDVAAAYKKADEQKEFCVQTRESYIKEFQTPPAPKPKPKEPS